MTIEKFVKKILDNTEMMGLLNSISHSIPEYYYDENSDLMQMEKPPPIIIQWSE